MIDDYSELGFYVPIIPEQTKQHCRRFLSDPGIESRLCKAFGMTHTRLSEFVKGDEDWTVDDAKIANAVLVEAGINEGLNASLRGIGKTETLLMPVSDNMSPTVKKRYRGYTVNVQLKPDHPF